MPHLSHKTTMPHLGHKQHDKEPTPHLAHKHHRSKPMPHLGHKQHRSKPKPHLAHKTTMPHLGHKQHDKEPTPRATPRPQDHHAAPNDTSNATRSPRRTSPTRPSCRTGHKQHERPLSLTRLGRAHRESLRAEQVCAFCLQAL